MKLTSALADALIWPSRIRRSRVAGRRAPAPGRRS